MNICILSTIDNNIQIITSCLNEITLNLFNVEITVLHSATELTKLIDKMFFVFILDYEFSSNCTIKNILENLFPRAYIVTALSEQEYENENTCSLQDMAIYKEIENVIIRAVLNYTELNSVLSIKTKTRRYQIPINKIKYVESYNRQISFHTTDNTICTSGKMNDYLKFLCPHGFIRVHQSFLVNTEFIESIEKNNVILNDGTRIGISRERKKFVLTTFDKFLKINTLKNYYDNRKK